MVKLKDNKIDWETTKASGTPSVMNNPTEEVVETTEVVEAPEEITNTTAEATTDTTTETAEETPTEEAAEDVSITNPLSSYLKEAGEKAAASEAEAQALLQAYNEALKNGDSALLSLLQDAEPKRDENKEERLRKRAIIQGFGDLMSSIAMGAHAFGKNGMGYVPQLKESSALKSIEELNRLREEYAKKKEAWDGVMLNYRMGAEQAKVEGKKALATAAEKQAKADRENFEKLRLEAEKLGIDLSKFLIGEQNENARAAAKIMSDRQIAAAKAAQDAKGKKSERTETREEAARRAFDFFNPWVAQDKGKGEKSTYKEDLPYRDSQMWFDDKVRAFLLYWDKGMTVEEAIEEVLKDNK